MHNKYIGLYGNLSKASLKKMNAILVCVTRWVLATFLVFGALEQSGKLMPMAFELKIIKLKVKMFVYIQII